MTFVRTVLLSVVVLTAWASAAVSAPRQEPVRYAVRIPAPATHELVVEAIFPAKTRGPIELMMPTWSPGYYRVEDYAAKVHDLAATDDAGRTLAVSKPRPNRWRVETNGAGLVHVSYGVHAEETTVTTNFVGERYAVLNGAPTFMTLVEGGPRPHEVLLHLPDGWTAETGLDAVESRPWTFRARDYDTLVDSPFLAGELDIRRFDVAGVPHVLASAGTLDGWDGARATRDLQTFVEEARRFWGHLPYRKYAFLMLFRPGGGGLEHGNSNLSTVLARPRPRPDGSAPPASAGWPSLGLEAHEYFHLFNVKRLRPVELGPFDYEKPPTTGGLWIAEGVTSYYSDLLLTRAGLRTPDEYLRGLSSLIRALETAPGRKLQSVEQSSREVWGNSNSGIAPTAGTVSYYDKGQVLGLLLDAKIRRATNGRRSFDDVMRQAYRQYGGARGYTADQFRAVAERIAGVDLRPWFAGAVAGTADLDYTDLLEWYGLRFSGEGTSAWTIERRADQTPAQRAHLDAWLTGR